MNGLITLLYPISPVIPSSYEKVFALLATCQQYDMKSVQYHVRVKIKRGVILSPLTAEGFGTYAIASSMGLIPEMKNAARLTLRCGMSFESIGEGLRF